MWLDWTSASLCLGDRVEKLCCAINDNSNNNNNNTATTITTTRTMSTLHIHGKVLG